MIDSETFFFLPNQNGDTSSGPLNDKDLAERFFILLDWKFFSHLLSHKTSFFDP